MGRLIVAAVVSLTMSGCAVVAAVGGTAVEGLAYLLGGAEESFSISMRTTLVAVQKGLKKADLAVSVLEPVENGYLITFGNENLDGKVSLKKQTKSLVTVSVKVSSGGIREDSVEQALVDAIRKKSETVNRFERFDFGRYRNIREMPKISAKKVGWYLPGTFLDVHSLKDSKWLRIKMPSGKMAYLKGSIAAFTRK
ncbi:MAG: DUF3568 family protein [Mariprofundaceae bacterium]|nr:DUF3568 family protein [Mariprofundaceae bacterium]